MINNMYGVPQNMGMNNDAIIEKFEKDKKEKNTDIKKLYKKNEEDIDKIVDFSDIQKGDIYVN